MGEEESLDSPTPVGRSSMRPLHSIDCSFLLYRCHCPVSRGDVATWQRLAYLILSLALLLCSFSSSPSLFVSGGGEGRGEGGGGLPSRYVLHPTCVSTSSCARSSSSPAVPYPPPSPPPSSSPSSGATSVNVSLSPLGVRVAGRRVTGRVVHLFDDPLSTFSVYPPAVVGCGGGRVEVSVSSLHYGCEVAMNGGFFQISHPAAFCLNAVVSDSQLVQTQATYPHNREGGEEEEEEDLLVYHHRNVHFGVTSHDQFFIGHIDDDDDFMARHTRRRGGARDVDDWHFVQLLSGVVWLVRDGVSHVNRSWSEEEDQSTPIPPDTFISAVSARTLIGHDRHGHLMLMVVDGKSWQHGVDLVSMAELALEVGLINAINLDGGGSATLTLRHVLINSPSEDACPHRQFTIEACERPVTTIVCIHAPHDQALHQEQAPPTSPSNHERPPWTSSDSRLVSPFGPTLLPPRGGQGEDGQCWTLEGAMATTVVLVLLLALLVLSLMACRGARSWGGGVAVEGGRRGRGGGGGEVEGVSHPLLVREDEEGDGAK